MIAIINTGTIYLIKNAHIENIDFHFDPEVNSICMTRLFMRHPRNNDVSNPPTGMSHTDTKWFRVSKKSFL